MTSLIDHPFWEASEPSDIRLVRLSRILPPELNPFHNEGVTIQIAGVPGEAKHSKWIVARSGIYDGVLSGRITPDTTVIEATSGNTGEGLATVCNLLGVPFLAVMSSDVPQEKVDAIRIIGRRTGVHLMTDADETTVEYARRKGREDGYYNPDQYANAWNPDAHYTYLAPQVWKQQPKISILFPPGGTMGTYIGLARYARDRGTGTTVIPVVCAEGEEVPGARTLSSIKKDVRQKWQEYCSEEDFVFGSRHLSFFLSFLTWSYLVPHLGPSSGLALAGAYQFLKTHRDAGTLEQFRQDDKKIRVVVFGPDDNRPYHGLYFGELKKGELSSKIAPSDLLARLDS